MVDRINNNRRCVTIPCIECNSMLEFRIEGDVVVEADGRIAINVPCVVCEDCVESLLDRVADPPGLIIFDGLSAILVREILRSFAFLLSRSEAIGFFSVLFPEIGYGEAELDYLQLKQFLKRK
jgi:hypothetical protein